MLLFGTIALNEKVKQKLDKMVSEEIIVPVTEPMDWVNLIVVVPKNACSAFLQIPITYESLLLCTITTAFGRYRYLRLPSSPEIFQRYIHEVLDGTSGVIAYFDDVLVYGKTLDEHHDNLNIVLTKIKHSGLTRLLSDKVEWIWTQNEESCFKRIKQLVSSAVTLTYMNPEKQITLSIDASPYVLGALISQDNKPIEFASESLTPTQQKYNHIEKELAVVFGCERFNFYLFTQNFNIETDHRPLGKNLKVPDTLSRDSPFEMINTDYVDTNLRVFSVVTTSKVNEQRLQKAINEDMTLQKIKYYVLNGWPLHKSNVPGEVKKYSPIKNPCYPKSNGQVERTIQTIKGLMLKAIKNIKDPFIAVLDYNFTPKQNLPAPSISLMGKRIRTLLISTALLQQLYPIEEPRINRKFLKPMELPCTDESSTPVEDEEQASQDLSRISQSPKKSIPESVHQPSVPEASSDVNTGNLIKTGIGRVVFKK
ncbi:hypothetical protein ILUMI_21827, partial [Ignelater luminosus]